MDHKHVTKDFWEMVDALHPLTFASLTKDFVSSEKIRKTLLMGGDTLERNIEIFANLVGAYEEKSRLIAEKLFSRGKNREMVRKSLLDELGSCPDCEERYRVFLTYQVHESRKPESYRGPYNDIPDADKDFLQKYQGSENETA